MRDCGVRLSEKTIEVNFCAQLSSVVPSIHWWFGLTQRQESEAGWDVAGKVNGVWTLFQLKASAHVLASGARRFRAKHDQLVSLQARATVPSKVYYVLPRIGTTADLTKVGFDLVSNVRLLDVYDTHGVGPPTTRGGWLRKSEEHYVDLAADGLSATIHSDPFEVRVRPGAEIELPRDWSPDAFTDRDRAAGVSQAREFLASGRNRVALFVNPQ